MESENKTLSQTLTEYTGCWFSQKAHFVACCGCMLFISSGAYDKHTKSWISPLSGYMASSDSFFYLISPFLKAEKSSVILADVNTLFADP